MEERFYFGTVRELAEQARTQSKETFVATDKSGRARCKFDTEEILSLVLEKVEEYASDEDDTIIGMLDVADFDVYLEDDGGMFKGKRSVLVPEDSTIDEKEVIFFTC